MAKLKLNLEDLKVESFATTRSPNASRGTVFGQTIDQTGGCCITVDPSCDCSGTGCPTANGGSCEETQCNQPPCTDTCAFNTQQCADTCNAGTGACGPTCGEVSCNNEYTCPAC